MTVAELIEELKKLPQDAPVYVYDGCDPAPEYWDWGDPTSQDRGVYL
jgi:hypothetical protein